VPQVAVAKVSAITFAHLVEDPDAHRRLEDVGGAGDRHGRGDGDSACGPDHLDRIGLVNGAILPSRDRPERFART
jgi:hypothetical protein